MKIDFCRDCKFVAWMVGIGLGVRCVHPTRQEKREGLPSLISTIDNCQLKVQENLVDGTGCSVGDDSSHPNQV